MFVDARVLAQHIGVAPALYSRKAAHAADDHTHADRSRPCRISHRHQRLAEFEPAALLVDQPLSSGREVPADPVAYGQRLLAALGGDTLRAEIERLPHAPNMGRLIAIRTDDAD